MKFDLEEKQGYLYFKKKFKLRFKRINFDLNYLFDIIAVKENINLFKRVKRYPEFMFKYDNKGFLGISGKSIRKAFYNALLPIEIYASLDKKETIEKLEELFIKIPFDKAEVITRIPFILDPNHVKLSVYVNTKGYGFLVGNLDSLKSFYEKFIKELEKTFILQE